MQRDGGRPRLALPDCILPDGSVVAITCRDGRIESVEPVPGAPALLALPRLAEAHVHLDKTFYGGRLAPHRPASSLAQRIEEEVRLLGGGHVEPVGVRAGRLLAALVANGAGAIRSHVDVSARLGLSRVEPLLELRARSPVPLQLVAFPQEGVARSPGTAKLLAEALVAGCDAVGGLDPAAYDGDRAGQLELVAGLAAEHGRRLDVHLHERGEEGARTLALLCRLVGEVGLRDRAAVSHGFVLADLWRAGGRSALQPVAEAMAAAGVALVTNLPGEQQCPPVAALLELGVDVAVASDNIRDSWSPFGRADPLERAAAVAQLEGWRSRDELERALGLVSSAPARLLGLEPPVLAPGGPADLVLVPADDLAEALAVQPSRRALVVAGSIVGGAELLGRHEAELAAAAAGAPSKGRAGIPAPVPEPGRSGSRFPG